MLLKRWPRTASNASRSESSIAANVNQLRLGRRRSFLLRFCVVRGLFAAILNGRSNLRATIEGLHRVGILLRAFEIQSKNEVVSSVEALIFSYGELQFLSGLIEFPFNEIDQAQAAVRLGDGVRFAGRKLLVRNIGRFRDGIQHIESVMLIGFGLSNTRHVFRIFRVAARNGL